MHDPEVRAAAMVSWLYARCLRGTWQLGRRAGACVSGSLAWVVAWAAAWWGGAARSLRQQAAAVGGSMRAWYAGDDQRVAGSRDAPRAAGTQLLAAPDRTAAWPTIGQAAVDASPAAAVWGGEPGAVGVPQPHQSAWRAVQDGLVLPLLQPLFWYWEAVAGLVLCGINVASWGVYLTGWWLLLPARLALWAALLPLRLVAAAARQLQAGVVALLAAAVSAGEAVVHLLGLDRLVEAGRQVLLRMVGGWLLAGGRARGGMGRLGKPDAAE